MRPIRTIVVSARPDARATAATDRRVAGVAADHIETIAAPAERQTVRPAAPGSLHPRVVKARAPTTGPKNGFTPDPALNYPGLMWDFPRIGAADAWQQTPGDPSVRVGVADTGLDFTHPELKPQVKQVVDFTKYEDPPLCKDLFGQSDQDLHEMYGGPVTGDWFGHGSWIGGNIAAALDGKGVNGIAPSIGLVSLKIAQWCGYAYDSTILDAFLFAANHGIDIVSISFGGYLDRSDPSQDLIWKDYVAAVQYAKMNGTAIVAAAGNEHTRIGSQGLVLTHGTLTTPGGDVFDAFGWYEVPGGVPGVVDVSSTGNVVNPSSVRCPPGSIGDPDNFNATCKPKNDPHQAGGSKKEDQLAYYSNFGPRIDIAAPGGARKFNLPYWDRGGTPGFPYTSDDLTNVWEDFSITSNWATQIPCFVFTKGSGFHQGDCYTAIQGTSMATPHVSAVLALIISQHPNLRHDVNGMVAFLEGHARPAHNLTQVTSATDTSAGDLSEVDCTSGYCHLGGARISDSDAYGAGLLQAKL
jgi:subtilisin family serine protease